MSWLSEPPPFSEDCLLTAYEYQPGGDHRVGTRQVYAAILEEVKRETSFRRKLARIPASHFIWSDHLAKAFNGFIDLFMTREDAAAEGVGLRWNVAVDVYASLIGECPNFRGDGPSRRQERKFETAARHAQWQKRVDEKCQKNPRLSHDRIAKLVSADLRKEGQEFGSETIRRVTKSKKI